MIQILLAGVCAICVITALVIWLYDRRQLTMTRSCAARLVARGGEQLTYEVSGSARRVAGVVNGLGFGAVLVYTRSSGARTWIDVNFGPCDLSLSLRKRTEDEERAADREEAREVEIGDLAFDEAWIVEGAPKDCVKRLLADASLRERLAVFRTFKGASITIADGKVMVAHHGWALRGGVSRKYFATDVIELGLALATAAIAESAPPGDWPEPKGAHGPALGPGRADVAKLKEPQARRAAKAKAARHAGLGTLVSVVHGGTSALHRLISGRPRGAPEAFTNYPLVLICTTLFGAWWLLRAKTGVPALADRSSLKLWMVAARALFIGTGYFG